jgi:hypothetical protein
MNEIDVDRGVSIRQVTKFENQYKFAPDPKYGGLTVYMYVDEPGIYYDVHGRLVPEGLAQLAGFEVDKNAKLRNKREAMAKFEKRLAEELLIETDDEEVVIAAEGDWKVVALPMDRAKIVDISTGEAVTAVPMPRGDALVLLAHLTGTAQNLEQSAAKTAAVNPEEKKGK